MSDTNNQVEKALLAESGDTFQGAPSGPNPHTSPDDRGLNIYNVSQLQGVTGRAKGGARSQQLITRIGFSPKLVKSRLGQLRKIVRYLEPWRLILDEDVLVGSELRVVVKTTGCDLEPFRLWVGVRHRRTAASAK